MCRSKKRTCGVLFFFKQKTAYEMRISDWSSDVCSSDLAAQLGLPYGFASHFAPQALDMAIAIYRERFKPSAQLAKPYVLVGMNVIAAESDDEARRLATTQQMRSEEHTSELQSLMRRSYDVFCLNKKKQSN